MNPERLHIPDDGRHCTQQQAAMLLEELREVFQSLPQQYRAEVINVLHSQAWTWVN